jgi:hypothetical protein
MTTPDIAEARRLADNLESNRCHQSAQTLRALADELERLRAQVAKNDAAVYRSIADRYFKDAAPAQQAEPIRPVDECYGDCATGDQKTCPNPCKFEGRYAPATPSSTVDGWKLLEDGVTAIPADWLPLRLEWEPGYPEDVAFGPTHLMERLKKWLEKFFAMRLTEPVAWESRFAADGDNAWRRCSREHHALVQATPDEWQGYETRALYAAPQPPAQGVELPPLPPMSDLGDSGASNYGYSADDMRAYARAALAQAPTEEQP